MIAFFEKHCVGRKGLGSRRSRAGMALVVTLLFLVLVSIAILVFYTHATANRRIERTRAVRVETDILARSAAEWVVGGFLRDVANSSNSIALTTNGFTTYRPVTNNSPKMVFPRRIANVPLTDANFANLIRQSIAAADTNSSSISSAAPARNGRFIGADRWNAPYLLSGGGFTSTNQLPNWIFVENAGSGKTPPLTGTPSENVIGRFTYNIYDIGGLLDVTAAGHPAGALAEDLKATVAGADLSVLGLDAQTVKKLIEDFRNPGGGDYTNRVAVLDEKGFLSPVVGSTNVASYTNNFILTRQDLLRYAKKVNPGLTNALPYLTAFSRSVTGPSWYPKTNQETGIPPHPYRYLNYADDATKGTNRSVPGVRIVSPGTIKHYKDDQTTVNVPVRAGEPLVRRKFSLTRLGWIRHTGPADAAEAQAIRDCFGLEWRADAIGTGDPGAPPATPGWRYAGGPEQTYPAVIKTLAQVAAANREPNFFEVLKAGILTGSLGLNSTTGRPGDMQIVRIGLGAIDQYDADSYPTAAMYDGYALWGIEDLPYLFKVHPMFHWPRKNEDPTHALPPAFRPPVYTYLLYELWNPHKQPAGGTAAPADFRVRIGPDALFRIGFSQTSDDKLGSLNPPLTPGQIAFPSASRQYYVNNPPSILGDGESAEGDQDVQNDVLYFTATGTQYREPQLIFTGTKASSFLSASNDDGFKLNKPRASDINVVRLPASRTFSPSGPRLDGTGGDAAYLYIYYGVFVLEYRDPDDPAGVYRPYATFIGHEDNGGVDGIGSSTGGFFPSGFVNPGSLVAGYVKMDPRTARFGAQFFGDMEYSLRPDDATWRTVGNVSLPGAASPFQMARWAINDSSAGAGTFYRDPDNVIRPADYFYGAGNSYRDNDPNGVRPVVLNRPFRSVSELGYVFRDLPFKTLDFFTDKSADSALLDLFSLRDKPEVVAGLVSLYTRQPLVLQSLLKGTANVSDILAESQADVIVDLINPSGQITNNPPLSVAQLSDLLFAQPRGQNHLGDLKTAREAVLEALASNTQTRTWNFLIDVIAQTGRSSRPDSAPEDFIVEGESRYWLSIAIDRYTGRIVDQKWELVNE